MAHGGRDTSKSAPVAVITGASSGIGAATAVALGRKGFQIVAAIDIDPNKVGKDAGTVMELGRKLRVPVASDIGKALRASKPDVAVLCTSSSLKAVIRAASLRVSVHTSEERFPVNGRMAKGPAGKKCSSARP